MTPLLLAGVASAGPVELHGDVKSFFVATFPYEHLLMPEEPVSSALLDGRLKLGVEFGPHLKLEAHHAVTAQGGTSPGLGLTSTGAGAAAPEAVELGWEAVSGEGLRLWGRTDRLVLRGTAGPVDLALGRQPVSFGSGLIFTPMDLVNPFTPATIDQEYKPGVDALRVDVYPSASSKITAVAAYAGDWSADGLVLAAHGQATVGVTDLALFAGLGRGSPVFGAGLVSAIGPVGVHGDATLTLPDEEAGARITKPYARVVLGADGRPGPKTTITGEVYVQSFGETDPAGYLLLATDERYQTGELWAMGLLYAGAGLSQEIRPTLFASLSTVVNLTDPSALVAPVLSWSVAENADVVAGGYLGLGARPQEAVRSEYGLLPGTAFAQMKAYF